MNSSTLMKDYGIRYAKHNLVYTMHICLNINLNHIRIYLLTMFNLRGTNGHLRTEFNPKK